MANPEELVKKDQSISPDDFGVENYDNDQELRSEIESIFIAAINRPTKSFLRGKLNIMVSQSFARSGEGEDSYIERFVSFIKDENLNMDDLRRIDEVLKDIIFTTPEHDLMNNDEARHKAEGITNLFTDLESKIKIFMSKELA